MSKVCNVNPRLGDARVTLQELLGQRFCVFKTLLGERFSQFDFGIFDACLGYKDNYLWSLGKIARNDHSLTSV